MAMKIDQMFPSHTVTGRRNQNSMEANSEGAVEGKTGAHIAAGVRVTLTKSANNLAGLVKSVDGMSEASMERIEKLRSTINSGNYEINSQRIAKKLMDFEFGLK